MSFTEDTATILSSGVRLTVPLAMAACGEYLAERAGTLNISVEAMMLSAAHSAERRKLRSDSRRVSCMPDTTGQQGTAVIIYDDGSPAARHVTPIGSRHPGLLGC